MVLRLNKAAAIAVLFTVTICIMKMLREGFFAELGNPKTNINIIADRLMVSVQWLNDRIWRETGMHPREYLEMLRLEAAKDLLLRGVSVAETASKVGYAHTRTFARAFLRLYGITPGRWARDNRPPRKNQASMTVSAVYFQKCLSKMSLDRGYPAAVFLW